MWSPSRSIRAARCAIFLLVAGLADPAGSQESGALGGDRAIPPTPVPVGSGARAAGMSNAFIGIADDATAASWNPAGLVQLERPEFSIVGSLQRLQDRLSATGHPEFDGVDIDRTSDLNFLSVAAPLPFTLFSRNATVSLSYQRRFDFERSLDALYATGDLAPLDPPLAIGQISRLNFEQHGSLSAISPAFAMEITHELSFGVALNFWRSSFLSDNGWTQTTRNLGLTTAGPSLSLSAGLSHETYEDFRGENITAGILWRVNPRWRLGLRYDSAFTASADYRSRDLAIRIDPFAPGLSPLLNVGHQREQRHIRLPATWALGAAYRTNDRLTLALDVSRTDWNSFYVTDRRGRRFSLIDGADLANRTRRTDFDPTYTVRLGMEYALIPKEPGIDLPRLWTLRAGLSYEEEPASNRSTRSDRFFFRPGNGSPDRFCGASAGVGLLLGHRMNIDLAYQIRYGPGVNRDLNPGAAGFDSNELRQRVLLSAVLYF